MSEQKYRICLQITRRTWSQWQTVKNNSTFTPQVQTLFINGLMFTIETIARYEYFNIAWYNTSSISYTQKKLRLFVISICAYASHQTTSDSWTIWQPFWCSHLVCKFDLPVHFETTPVFLASALTPVRFVSDGVIHRPWRSSTPSNSWSRSNRHVPCSSLLRDKHPLCSCILRDMDLLGYSCRFATLYLCLQFCRIMLFSVWLYLETRFPFYHNSYDNLNF